MITIVAPSRRRSHQQRGTSCSASRRRRQPASTEKRGHLVEKTITGCLACYREPLEDQPLCRSVPLRTCQHSGPFDIRRSAPFLPGSLA